MLAMTLIGLILGSSAQAASRVKCAYNYYSAPYAEVSIGFKEDGSLEDAAEITMYGRAHSETVTPAPLAAGEKVHLWLSKDTENEIEMLIYTESRPQGQSKIINHSSPYGKEMWGNCTGL